MRAKLSPVVTILKRRSIAHKLTSIAALAMVLVLTLVFAVAGQQDRDVQAVAAIDIDVPAEAGTYNLITPVQILVPSENGDIPLTLNLTLNVTIGIRITTPMVIDAVVTVLPTNTPIPTATNTPTPTPEAASATANSNANLRGGPGTNFAIAGSAAQGDALDIVGRNAAGDWYELAGGNWIAAFLVDDAPANVPVSDNVPPAPPTATQAPPATATSAPEAAAPVVVQPAAAPAGAAKVIIQSVFYDGLVSRVESDEYAVIANTGTASINLAGWRLNAGDNGQDFRFPSYDLAPGASCRVYTNQFHPESCGFSFGRGQAIWNNGGDCGFLYNASGAEVSRYCY